MHTDKIPRAAAQKTEYQRSDLLRSLTLPPLEPAQAHAMRLKQALAAEDMKEVKLACEGIITALASAYNVRQPTVKILNARPRKVNDNWVHETFGDYDLEKAHIRLWMRTAVQKKATSYGTFLSTLCHEFCHHLDLAALELPSTFHTRGFYERTALIYHHIQGTPVREIAWRQQNDGTYRVDWAATMRRSAV